VTNDPAVERLYDDVTGTYRPARLITLPDGTSRVEWADDPNDQLAALLRAAVPPRQVVDTPASAGAALNNDDALLGSLARALGIQNTTTHGGTFAGTDSI
jgi:hypothetical protein